MSREMKRERTFDNAEWVLRIDRSTRNGGLDVIRPGRNDLVDEVER